MTTQTMASPQEARIAKFKGAILKHVQPVEIIGKCCKSMKQMIPKNVSETVIFRRWLPKGSTSSSPNTWNVVPADHRLNEGETPTAEALSAQDISVSLLEYGVLYRHSNRVADMYEDDVPAAHKLMVGQRMGLLLEMIRWGVLKAGTNVYRAGNVASRASVIALISANLLRNVARGLEANIAQPITGILAPSQNIATQPIEAAYVVVCHSDMEADIRSQLSGFVHVSEYGTRKVIHERELGSWERFRFVTSPHLAPYLNGGSTTTANTRLAGGVANSAGTENVDVYPLIVLAEEAYGDVMLRGENSISPTYIPANTKTKDDPLGQRGYVGASTYFNAVRLNEGHMAVIESACSSL